jgi:FkbM family methyltransferase
MIIEVDGLSINLVDTEDRQVIHLEAGDGYEHDSLEVWAKMIKPGTTVLDVGAYTGLYSIIAALRGAKVIAFEPMPANRWRLGVNMLRNKVRISVVAAAVSDTEGTATLNYNPHVALTTGASIETGIAMHSAGLVVQCLTIDSLGLENVGAIKIDVERHEPCVLRGAMQTIERYRPPMLVETLEGAMRDTILNQLPAYDAAAILDGRNTLFTPKRESAPCRKVQSQEQHSSK